MNDHKTRGTSVVAALRALVPERPLTYREAETVAELQANRCRELLGVEGVEFPEEAIAGLPRVTVTREADLPVSGLAQWHDGRWFIAVNALEPWSRQRFSLAHELHHVLGHTTKQWLCADEAGFPEAAKAERLADYFAGCLLMPKRHVKRLFGEGRSAPELATAFGVSPRAIAVRLSQLGLSEPLPRCAGRPAPSRRFGGAYHRALPVGGGVAA